MGVIPHDHVWRVYDIYWATPPMGNLRCEVCGERRKGMKLSQEQADAYVATQPDYKDDDA